MCEGKDLSFYHSDYLWKALVKPELIRTMTATIYISYERLMYFVWIHFFPFSFLNEIPIYCPFLQTRAEKSKLKTKHYELITNHMLYESLNTDTDYIFIDADIIFDLLVTINFIYYICKEP